MSPVHTRFGSLTVISVEELRKAGFQEFYADGAALLQKYKQSLLYQKRPISKHDFPLAERSLLAMLCSLILALRLAFICFLDERRGGSADLTWRQQGCRFETTDD